MIASLPSMTDELTSLLENSADHVAPTRGETRGPARSFRLKSKRPSQTQQEGGRLFLTFDDGPLPCTGRILDQLAASGQTATFFVLGRNLSNPSLRQFAVRALKEGHDIGNHSFSHPYFSAISMNRAKQEIVSTYRLIDELVLEAEVDPNRQNRFFRFPYGVAGSRSNYLASQDVLGELNYKIAWWDLDTNDWRMELPWFPTRPSSVVASLNRARPGDVVLLHDRVKTSECLPAILKSLEWCKLASLPLSSYDSGTVAPSEKAVPDENILSSKSTNNLDADALAEELSQALFPQGHPADIVVDSAVVAPRVSRGSNLW
ncbi:MAG: polysaccharide deacetylase family protein [Desulfomonile tiedjei]|nr:polysaccharide deacetylase family protein [Desulfomonile tiedjei]